MRSAAISIVIGILVAGCQAVDNALPTNSVQMSVTGSAAGAIAGDMATRLAEQIGSATTTPIRLRKDRTEYAAALEAALKGWGYTVITDDKVSKDQKPVEISYALNSIDGQIFAQLATPSLALSRTYATTAAGTNPTSPLSIMRRN